ncbi:tRNA pseudouridine(38-40) synthase TruA [Bacteroidia bacterium]|nr:tRNA pseudouridine(38-40) synthase TruA [Bacteroidia bacterium]MDB9883304.1 tRNA pseudouridine(38-40) synthase TruA [Bacteroidia bacterium]
MRYALELAYKGTGYRGWQSQKNSTTIQEHIELQLARLFQVKTNVLGCGRTDAEVHASHFIAHFDAVDELPPRFKFRLNQMLPKDIAIYDVFPVKDNFHARFSASYRKYVYKTTFNKNPFREDEMLFLFKEPSVELMNQACKELLENNDFAAFSKKGDTKTTLCDLMEAQWIEVNGHLEFHVKANRFLRNMVRALVGTLLEVGYGNVSIERLKEIIESKDRSHSGKSVAAKGLYLCEVGYNWDEFRK